MRRRTFRRYVQGCEARADAWYGAFLLMTRDRQLSARLTRIAACHALRRCIAQGCEQPSDADCCGALWTALQADMPMDRPEYPPAAAAAFERAEAAINASVHAGFPRDVLERGLDGLPAFTRCCIVLYAVLGCSLDDIALGIGSNVATVRAACTQGCTALCARTA